MPLLTSRSLLLLYPLIFSLGVAENAFAQTSAEPLAFAQRLVFPGVGTTSGTSDQYAMAVTRIRVRWPVFLDGKRTILLPGVSYEHLDIGMRGPLASRLVRANSPS